MAALRRLVIDATRPGELAEFWAALLGWEVTTAGGVTARAPASNGCELDLGFAPVATSKHETVEAKNRIHLDLASTSPDDQATTVARAVELGARKWDIGQGAVPWQVMVDPEGNEFCVLEPRPNYTTGALAAIVVDSLDPFAAATFWAAVTGWRIAAREDVIVGLRAAGGGGPWLEFLRTAEPRTGPDRLRLEVAGEEPDRLRELGARIAGAGHLLDPEGNEFLLA
ncbi:VOC family protein [Amycolatopsis taiwanensis]|uniref:VOC family protein n=1 Tax=Amycolatopsis taiwanensis TaxID=342230 RepID=UPI0004801C06|nr:VOC family protein [Amycolatopsis taiwanensis]